MEGPHKGSKIVMCVYVCVYLSSLVSKELPCIVDDLFISHVTIGLLLTHTQHLPQSHPKRPHITGCSKLTLIKIRIIKILNIKKIAQLFWHS